MRAPVAGDGLYGDGTPGGRRADQGRRFRIPGVPAVRRGAEIKRHVQTVQEEWASRGVTFRENERIRLITVFFHDKPTEEESLLFVGHVGVLLTAEDETLYFVEKVAFQEPYRMLRFADRTALSDYLMGKYDTSWGQDTARPFIMENDELMDGWRPNPDSGSSALG